jgi:DNA-nicking Smr family endonuclease
MANDGVVTGETDNMADAPAELPIDGTLDLHTFRPQDVKDVVIEYLRACRERNILEVRVVHGKGIGQLRQTVHAVLTRLPFVEGYAIAGEHYGGAGATFVKLRPKESAGAVDKPGGRV